MLGRLQLQVGNVAAAEDAYAQLECLIADADEHPDVRLNRGFLAVALGDYEAALPEFEAVLALDPSHAAAANNAAVCQLYCCRLPDAIRTLEGFLRADPARNTQQAVVANLGALWDESRSLRYMAEQWQEVCREADTDNSGTLEEAEVVLIWEKALGLYTKMVAEKLEKLGVASKVRKKAPEVVQAI